MNNNAIINLTKNIIFHAQNHVVCTHTIGYDLAKTSIYVDDIDSLLWQVLKKLHLDTRKTLLLSSEIVAKINLELIFMKK